MTSLAPSVHLANFPHAPNPHNECSVRQPSWLQTSVGKTSHHGQIGSCNGEIMSQLNIVQDNFPSVNNSLHTVFPLTCTLQGRGLSDWIMFSFFNDKQFKLDVVGPVDNRPSTD